MDSLFTILSGTLDKLTGFVEQQSPAVWAILIKQVYANAVANVVGSLLGFAGAGVCYWLARLGLKKTDNDDGWMILITFGFIAMLVGFSIGIVCGITAFKEFYNPAYYAIQFLLP